MQFFPFFFQFGGGESLAYWSSSPHFTWSIWKEKRKVGLLSRDTFVWFSEEFVWNEVLVPCCTGRVTVYFLWLPASWNKEETFLVAERLDEKYLPLDKDWEGLAYFSIFWDQCKIVCSNTFVAVHAWLVVDMKWWWCGSVVCWYTCGRHFVGLYDMVIILFSCSDVKVQY